MANRLSVLETALFISPFTVDAVKSVKHKETRYLIARLVLLRLKQGRNLCIHLAPLAPRGYATALFHPEENLGQAIKTVFRYVRDVTRLELLATPSGRQIACQETRGPPFFKPSTLTATAAERDPSDAGNLIFFSTRSCDYVIYVNIR